MAGTDGLRGVGGMGGVGGVQMLLRRWRADRGLLAVLVVVVALTAGLVGSVPRLLDRLALSSLDSALDDATADRVGLAATTVQRFTADDPQAALARLDAIAQELTEGLDPALRAALGAPTPVVDSVRYDLGTLPGEAPDSLERKLTIRLQQGVEEHLTLVEGDLPDGEPGVIELDLDQVGPEGEPILTELPVREFVATASTAESLAMEVGDRRLASPDSTGPIMSRLTLPQVGPVVFELAGLVELTPQDDPVWFGDPRVHRASRFDTNVSTTIFGVGLVPPSVAGEFPGGAQAQPASVGVRWPLDRAGLLSGDTEAVRQAAVALRTAAPLQLEEPRYSTGLDRILTTEAARRATAVEVLGLGAVAVLGIAVALLFSVTAVLAVRRRDAVALVRGRGASRGQLVAAAAVELTLVAVLGAVAAQLVLALALPGGGRPWVVPAVTLLALAVLIAGSLRDVRRRLGELLAERRRTPLPRPTRYVLDGLLVVVAAVAVASLRRRGIEVDGTIDPLVIAAPVLVAAAAAVVTARLAPLPLRAAEAAARRTRSMAVPVGLARAARSSGGGVVVVLLVLGLGVAGLAASVHRSLVAGQERAAQERVGADVRVDAPVLASLTPGWVPPSDGDLVAELSLETRASAVSDIGAQRIDVLLVEPDQVDALGLAPGLPLAWDGVGPAPLVVSSDLRLVGSPDVGDPLTVLLGGQDRIAGEVVAFDPRVLGRDESTDGPFIVLDRAAALAATGLEPGVTSRLVRTDDPAAVEAAATAADPDAEVLVRERIEQDLRTAPLSQGVRIGYLVAAVAAIAATAVALLMALAAAAPGRRRQAAVLAALGAPHSRVRLALVAEVVPPVAAAATVGVALAAVVSLLLGGRLDLSPFTGTVDQTDLVLPHWSMAVLLVAGAIVIAIVGAMATLGRVDPGALLREGDG